MDVGNCELQFSVISDNENSEAWNTLAQPISEVRNTVTETPRVSKCSESGLLDVVIFVTEVRRQDGGCCIRQIVYSTSSLASRDICVRRLMSLSYDSGGRRQSVCVQAC